MTKLRNRLLVTLALLAVFVTVAGVGSASAQGQSQPVPVTQPQRPAPGVGPFSGEPDGPGQSTPVLPTPKSTPTIVTVPVGSDLWLWLLWLQSLGQIVQ